MAGTDTPRRPDVPPPQPKPPQPDPAKHADWQARNEATMTRRPEKIDTGPRGADRAGPRQPGATDGTQQRGTRPDATGKPAEAHGAHLADHKEMKAELRTVRDTRDIGQYRENKPGRPVDMPRLEAAFTAKIKEVADERKASGNVGGRLVDVRLQNVRYGKGSEAVAIQQSLTKIGRDKGVIVRVSVVDRNGQVRSPAGTPLATAAPRVRTPADGVGKPDPAPRPPGPAQPRPTEQPRPKPGDTHPQQPGGPPRPPQPPNPPHPTVPVPPHVYQHPPDIHRR
jgi:hypothetical protein